MPLDVMNKFITRLLRYMRYVLFSKRRCYVPTVRDMVNDSSCSYLLVCTDGRPFGVLVPHSVRAWYTINRYPCCRRMSRSLFPRIVLTNASPPPVRVEVDCSLLPKHLLNHARSTLYSRPSLDHCCGCVGKASCCVLSYIYGNL